MDSMNVVLQLIKDVENLKKENIETTNILYEIQNRIDMIEYKLGEYNGTI